MLLSPIRQHDDFDAAHFSNAGVVLIGKINSTSRLPKRQVRIKDRNAQMTEDHSLPSMGSIGNIFLACNDIHSRLGSPRCMDIRELPPNSYSGCVTA